MLFQSLCVIVLAVAPFAQAAPVAEADLDTRYIYTQKHTTGIQNKRENAELDARYIYTQKHTTGVQNKRDDGAELDARYIYTQKHTTGAQNKREEDGVFHPAA